jgi:hypothetical protein
MTSLHHSFNAEHAAEYGIAEAVLIHHLQHWITKNRILNRNFIDGRTWTYQTQEEIASNFPYMGKYQIFRLLKNLENAGVILKGNFNKTSYDRTTWYSFVDEDKFLPAIDKLKKRNINEADSQSGGNDSATCIKGTDPVPDAETKRERAPTAPKKPTASSRALHVSTSDEEHRKLIEEFGAEKTQKMYQALSDWKQITPKYRWKKGDYASVLRWGVDALKEKEEKPQGKESRKEKDLEFMKRVFARYQSRTEITFTKDYIVFSNGPREVYANLGDHGFQEIVINELRKRQLNIDGLVDM